MTEDIAVEMFKTFLKLIEDGTYFKGVQQPEYKIKAQQKFLLMVSKKLLEVIPPNLPQENTAAYRLTHFMQYLGDDLWSDDLDTKHEKYENYIKKLKDELKLVEESK